MDIADITKNSILVSAHPDDEILWFSSILKNVDEILFCFLEMRSKPHKTNGRKQTLSEYPLKNVSCLGIDESEAFWDVDWQNPVITEYGIEIANNPSSSRRYEENYHTLRLKLKSRLKGYKNVVTHNPWGEYGHADHVQIYRAVKDLQNELGFNLWFSNYCSNKSFSLMLEYISGFDTEYLTFLTDTALAETIRNLYRKNGGWTWYDDWEWFNEESFMKDNYPKNMLKNSGPKRYGHIFPVNIIKVAIPHEQDEKSRTCRFSFIRRLVDRHS
jgi:LmbE family N-acetylglucosaminyl deacetylase